MLSVSLDMATEAKVLFFSFYDESEIFTESGEILISGKLFSMPLIEFSFSIRSAHKGTLHFDLAK